MHFFSGAVLHSPQVGDFDTTPANMTVKYRKNVTATSLNTGDVSVLLTLSLLSAASETYN